MSEIDYKLIAQALWSLLDDIDTALDHYKPNMKDNFVHYVSHKIRERGLYAESEDGQTLTFKKDIPKPEDSDAMTKWFKNAWRIAKNETP